jgi:hypothetical protein
MVNEKETTAPGIRSTAVKPLAFAPSEVLQAPDLHLFCTN